MRDPKEINKIINIIKDMWISHPDMRLMQLLLNTLPEEEKGISGDHYYMEDDRLIEHLKTFY